MSELQKQITHIVDKTHGILGDPMAQIEGKTPKEKLMIELPTGLTYLATYLSQQIKNESDFVKGWDFYERGINGQDKTLSQNLRRRMRSYIEWHIEEALMEELHRLSTTDYS